MKSYKDYLNRQLSDPEFAAGYTRVREELAFAVALAERREELGLTQQQLAKVTGIRQPMLARIERGQVPTPATLKKIAKGLQAVIVITPDAILLEPIAEAEAARLAVTSARIGEEYARLGVTFFGTATAEAHDATVSFTS